METPTIELQNIRTTGTFYDGDDMKKEPNDPEASSTPGTVHSTDGGTPAQKPGNSPFDEKAASTENYRNNEKLATLEKTKIIEEPMRGVK